MPGAKTRTLHKVNIESIDNGYPVGKQRTIAVDDDAYRVLEKLKRPGESFSAVIKRRFKAGNYSQLGGCWSDITDAELTALRRDLAQRRRRSDEKLADTLRRMGWD